MLLTASLVFVTVFGAVVLITMLLGTGGSGRRKQVLERLESLNQAVRRGTADEGINILREEVLTSIPTLNQWLLRLDVFPRLRQLLAQADLKQTLGGLLLAALALAAAVGLAVYWRTRVLPFAALLGLAAMGAPVGYVFFKRSQRFGRIELLLPQALDLMVNALRAGHSLVSAMEMVAKEMPSPIAEEFRKTFDEQNFGLDLRDALLNLALRVPTHDVHIVVTAILIQKETGGNLAEILDKVAYVIRERFRLRRQVRVHTAQGRLTGWILSLLPVILGVGMYLKSPHHVARLWQHPTGLKMMYAAVAMTLLGGLIIRKIIRIRV